MKCGFCCTRKDSWFMTGCGYQGTHPRHKGEDVVLLVFDGVFGVLLFTFLRAAKPHRPGLQLLPPPTYVGQAVTAAERGTR